jgi:hypothetical protein
MVEWSEHCKFNVCKSIAYAHVSWNFVFNQRVLLPSALLFSAIILFRHLIYMAKLYLRKMYSWRILYVCGIDVHAYNVMNEWKFVSVYRLCVFHWLRLWANKSTYRGIQSTGKGLVAPWYQPNKNFAIRFTETAKLQFKGNHAIIVANLKGLSLFGYRLPCQCKFNNVETSLVTL